MYCSNCGKEINDNADICLNCGTFIKKERPEEVKKVQPVLDERTRIMSSVLSVVNLLLCILTIIFSIIMLIVVGAQEGFIISFAFLLTILILNVLLATIMIFKSGEKFAINISTLITGLIFITVSVIVLFVMILSNS